MEGGGVRPGGGERGSARARTRVRVRRREGGTALEIDGTWASQRRAGKGTTASVWDLLAMPLLLAAPRARPRVLILGLGGGSAARVVREIAPRAEITGVEIDAEVVRVARRAFGLRDLGLEVRCEDARTALRRLRRRFDLLIEDVFIGRGDQPEKPPGFPEPALREAARRVAPGGILVSNSLDEARAVRRTQRALWPSVLELRLAGFDNCIIAGSTRPLEARALRRAVAGHPSLRECLGDLRVRSLDP